MKREKMALTFLFCRKYAMMLMAQVFSLTPTLSSQKEQGEHANLRLTWWLCPVLSSHCPAEPVPPPRRDSLVAGLGSVSSPTQTSWEATVFRFPNIRFRLRYLFRTRKNKTKQKPLHLSRDSAYVVASSAWSVCVPESAWGCNLVLSTQLCFNMEKVWWSQACLVSAFQQAHHLLIWMTPICTMFRGVVRLTWLLFIQLYKNVTLNDISIQTCLFHFNYATWV